MCLLLSLFFDKKEQKIEGVIYLVLLYPSTDENQSKTKMSTSHLKRKYLEECEAEVRDQMSAGQIEYKARCAALNVMETIREKSNEEMRIARNRAMCARNKRERS